MIVQKSNLIIFLAIAVCVAIPCSGTEPDQVEPQEEGFTPERYQAFLLKSEEADSIRILLRNLVKQVKSQGLQSVSFEKDISTPRVHFTSDIDQSGYDISIDVTEKIEKLKRIHIENPGNIRVVNGEILANLILYLEYRAHADIQNWELVFEKRQETWQITERRIVQYYTLSSIKVLPGEVYRLKEYELEGDSVRVHVRNGILAVGYAGNLPTAAVVMGDVEFHFKPNHRAEADILAGTIGASSFKRVFQTLYIRFHPDDLPVLFNLKELEPEPLHSWREKAQDIVDEREDSMDDLDLRIKSAHLGSDWSYIPRSRSFLLLEVQDRDQYWYTYIHDPRKDEQVWFGKHEWSIMSDRSLKITICRFACMHSEDRSSLRQHPLKEVVDIQHYSIDARVASDGLKCTAGIDFVNRGEKQSELEFTLYRELETLSVFDGTYRALIFFPMGDRIIIPLAEPILPQEKRTLTFLYRGDILDRHKQQLEERIYSGQTTLATASGYSSDTQVPGEGGSGGGASGEGGGGSMAEQLATNNFAEEEDAQASETLAAFSGETLPFWPEDFDEIGAGEGGDILSRSSPHMYFETGFFPWVPGHGYRDRATVETVLKVPQPFTGISVGLKENEWQEGTYNCSKWVETIPVVQPAFCYGHYKPYKGKLETVDLQVFGEKEFTENLESLNLSTAGSGQKKIYRRNEERLLLESSNIYNLFNELFGEYPFHKLTIAQLPRESRYNFNIVPASYTLLPLSLFLTSAQRMQINSPVSVKFNADLLGSNLARQWLGQLVGSNSYHDQWVLDSLAEYCGGIYLQSVFGDSDFKDWLQNRRNMAKKYDGIGPLYLGPRLGGKYVDLYRSKGVYIMHMLRMMLGDKYFAEAIKEFTRQFRYRNATMDDFKRIIEIIGITDLDYFYDQWIFSSGIPQFTFSYTIKEQKDGRYLVTGTVLQDKKVVKMPMPLWIYTSRKDKGKILVWIEKPQEEFSFYINTKPKKIVLDEFHWVLGDVSQ